MLNEMKLLNDLRADIDAIFKSFEEDLKYKIEQLTLAWFIKGTQTGVKNDKS